MTTNVFVSAPSARTTEQESFYTSFRVLLSDSGLRVRTVGQTDFGNRFPLETIQKVMRECAGAVIIGFAQLRIDAGVLKVDTPGERAVLPGTFTATVWNQLEAGMALLMSLPLLVIREPRVFAEGIFDPAVGDYFVHQAELSEDWLRSAAFTQPFGQWREDVRRVDGRRFSRMVKVVAGLIRSRR